MDDARRKRLAIGLTCVVALVSASTLVLSAPAQAANAGDEASFRTAWTNAAETEIDLTADISLTCGGGGVSIRSSASALTLNGNGFTITQTCDTHGVLQQTGTGALTIQDVTITGGRASGGGAGGGLNTVAPVTINRSTFTGNSSDNGGALFTTSDVTITGSTFNDNSSEAGFENGGAIQVAGLGSVTATNSTFSENTAGNAGGAITTTARPVTLVHVTMVNNSAAVGANVELSGSRGATGTLTAFGSVIALPQGGGENCASVTTSSNGHNFSDDSSCGFEAAGDTEDGGDPGLGELADNGGSTQTRLPAATSPLLNAIPADSCQDEIVLDQVGTARPQESGCEIGAVEVPAPAAPPSPPAPPGAQPVAAPPRFTG